MNETLKRALEALEDPVLLNGVNNAKFFINQALAQPPQRTWVGLTDEEVKTLRYKIDVTAHWTYDKFHEAIEAKLKEKNNGLL